MDVPAMQEDRKQQKVTKKELLENLNRSCLPYVPAPAPKIQVLVFPTPVGNQKHILQKIKPDTPGTKGCKGIRPG